jgi:hypothetical protein
MSRVVFCAAAGIVSVANAAVYIAGIIRYIWRIYGFGQPYKIVATFTLEAKT